MNHTIITIDLASIGTIAPSNVQYLMELLNREVSFLDSVIDLDEWKTTVIQVTPDGKRHPIAGYRSPDTGHHPDEIRGVQDEDES